MTSNEVNVKLDFIMHKLNELANKIDNIATENQIRDELYNQRAKKHLSTTMAVGKLQRENLALCKQMHKMIESVAGEVSEQHNEEIESLFPVSTLTEMEDMENRLQDVEFAVKLEKYLASFKGKLDSVFRFLATDAVYKHYNLDGRANKKSLNALKLYNKVLFHACGQKIGRDQFEKEIRRTVLASHNRYYKTRQSLPQAE